ncbi:permease prefix domain 1-containing protein [Desulfosporosinus sp. BICA1-9]|uniref:permease prefix domain 1-containing protein n=1 Tax=Desulfosporosinus sp. BICA1-9 TaxID=1531958 RepID=UPI000AB7E7DC|nr:permease prefix domain 1-containing protein [Desulfosporosinus sp. BICA1-9]
MFDLETEVHSWSDHLRAHGNLSDTDIHELENHLRDEIEDLIAAGLTPDESFLISVKRLGNVDAISHEFAKVNTESLWKHLLVDPIDSLAKQLNRRDITLVVIFALLAGTLFKIPELFGFGLLDQDGEIKIFFIKNLSFFILPFIAAFFLIKRKAGLKTWATILGIFILAAVIINVYPSFDPHHTEVLTIFHLPLFLWLVVGATYIGREWQGSKGRMNFIRFTGEAFIYGVLVMAGVMVLFLFTLVIFEAIQIDVEKFLAEYLLIYGGCAAAMITVYLVEAKKSVVENFAPILAKIFQSALPNNYGCFLNSYDYYR